MHGKLKKVFELFNRFNALKANNIYKFNKLLYNHKINFY